MRDSQAGPRTLRRAASLTGVAVLLACTDKSGIEWERERRVPGIIGPGAQLLISDSGEPAITTGWMPLRFPEDSTACAGTQVAVRARGDTAFAAWWRRNPYGHVDLMISRADDGRNWGTPVLSGGAMVTQQMCTRPPPGLATDPVTGAVFLVWHGMSNFGPGILFAEAASQGRPAALAYFLDSAATVRMVSVAVRGDTAAVAFEKDTKAGTEVRLALSLGKGHIPVARGVVSPGGTRAFAPLVALREGRVAVAWNEGRRGEQLPAAAARVGMIRR